MKQFIFSLLLVFASTALIAQEVKITASNAAAQDDFGGSIDMDQNYAVVGAQQKNNGGNLRGSAYIYYFDGTDWVEQAILTPDDAVDFDTFGHSVSISGDYVVVSANSKKGVNLQEGAAYIFHRTGTTWVQEAKIIASDAGQGDLFGSSVSIHGDYVAVGADHVATADGNGIGAVYIFHRSGTNWTEQAIIANPEPAENDYFGNAVGIYNDFVVIGTNRDDDHGPSSGSAYVYQRTGTTWNQVTKLHASDAQSNDNYGQSVDINDNQIVIGAIGNDDYGSNTGTVYIYKNEGGNWNEKAKLRAADPETSDKLGTSVAIFGDVIVAGAAYKGAAYIFALDNGVWGQRAKITTTNIAADAQFGSGVGISSDKIIVGAFKDDAPENNSGSAFVFPIPPALPEAIDDFVTIPANEATDIDVMANDTLNDAMTGFGIVTIPSHGVATVAGNIIHYTPDNNFCGSDDTFTYYISNASGNDTATVIITVLCVPPVAVNDNGSLFLDETKTFDVLANDTVNTTPENVSITLLTTPNHGTATVTGDKKIEFAAGNIFCGGMDSLSYVLQNGMGSDTATLYITIDCRDIIAVDDVANTAKNTSVTIDVLDNDTLYGQFQSLTILENPANGTASVNGANQIDYTPALDFCGSNDTLVYEVNTSSGIDTAEVVITVFCVIPPPTAVDDAASTTLNTPVNIDVLSNDTIVGTLTGFTVIDVPAHGTATISSSAINYSPENGYCGGMDTFTYAVSTAEGSDTATVTVSVVCPSVVNAMNDTVSTNINTPVTINVLSNDTFEAPLDAMGLAGNPSHGLLVINEDKTITYTPEADFCGSVDSFKYFIENDGEKDTATVFVNVLCAEMDAPVAVNDNTSTVINTAIDIDVLANDSNTDGLTGFEIINAPAHGTTTINGDNTVHYTPATDFCGDTDVFSYRIANAQGADTANVTVNVFCVSEVPIALPDTGSTYTNTIALVDILENDTIVGGITGIGFVQNPAHGTASLTESNILSYAPETGFCGGQDTLSYFVETSAGSDTAMVVITVNCVTFPAPTAVDDIFEAVKNVPATLFVLANDDVPGELIQLSIINIPVHGTATVSLEDDVINYVPETDFCDGQDTLTYAVETPAGIDTATVVINVSCVTEIVGYQGFSPNGDNVNDTFKIKNIESSPENHLRIFNRWGNLVYEKENYTNTDGWTGKFHDKDLPDGTYYYVLSLKNGKTVTGFVELRR